MDQSKKSFFSIDPTWNTHKYQDLSLYHLLGVTQNATEAQIIKAYRDLSRQYHPDKLKLNATNDPELLKNYQELFHKLNQSKDILLDKNKRRIYDLFGLKAIDEYQGLVKYGGLKEGNNDDVSEPSDVDLLLAADAFHKNQLQAEKLVENRSHKYKSVVKILKVQYEVEIKKPDPSLRAKRINEKLAYKQKNPDLPKDLVEKTRKKTKIEKDDDSGVSETSISLTQPTETKLVNNYYIYGISGEAETQFSNLFNIENLAIKPNISMDLEADNIESKLGLDLNHNYKNHYTELRCRKTIDTMQFEAFQKDEGMRPDEFDVNFIYQYANGDDFVLQNNLPLKIYSAPYPGKWKKLMSNFNFTTISTNLCKIQKYNYLSNLVFEFSLNIMDPWKSRLKVSSENIYVNPNLLKKMWRFSGSPYLTIGLNNNTYATSNKPLNLLTYGSKTHINCHNNANLTIEQSKNHHLEIKYEQKISKKSNFWATSKIACNGEILVYEIGFRKGGFEIMVPINLISDEFITVAVPTFLAGVVSYFALKNYVAGLEKTQTFIDEPDENVQTDEDLVQSDDTFWTSKIFSKIRNFKNSIFKKDQPKNTTNVVCDYGTMMDRFEMIQKDSQRVNNWLFINDSRYQTAVKKVKELHSKGKSGILILKAFYGHFEEDTSNYIAEQRNDDVKSKNKNARGDQTVSDDFIRRTTTSIDDHKNFVEITKQLQILASEQGKIELRKNAFLYKNNWQGFYNPSIYPGVMKVKIKYQTEIDGEIRNEEFIDGSGFCLNPTT